MAINVNTVKIEATNAVLEALASMYEETDKDSMRGFAEAIAEAAVVAVQMLLIMPKPSCRATVFGNLSHGCRQITFACSVVVLK